jgi:hypothetical protein
LLVIPAKAGIQCKYAVRSTQHKKVMCAAHAYLDWIPAFAGMTMRFEMGSM